MFIAKIYTCGEKQGPGWRHHRIHGGVEDVKGQGRLKI